MIDMTYWCESCARKNNCYTIRNRPKCFTPITSNDRTADRKTEPSCQKCKWWNSEELKCSISSVSDCDFEQTEPQTSKIIEAYSRGFKDGADAVKSIAQTEYRRVGQAIDSVTGKVLGETYDVPQTERSE